jgi:hypothetical protein
VIPSPQDRGDSCFQRVLQAVENSQGHSQGRESGEPIRTQSRREMSLLFHKAARLFHGKNATREPQNATANRERERPEGAALGGIA